MQIPKEVREVRFTGFSVTGGYEVPDVSLGMQFGSPARACCALNQGHLFIAPNIKLIN